MYSKIMNAKLKFPSTIPAEAANLIEGVRAPPTLLDSQQCNDTQRTTHN
jgi:hypothetical protein